MNANQEQTLQNRAAQQNEKMEMEQQGELPEQELNQVVGGMLLPAVQKVREAAAR